MTHAIQRLSTLSLTSGTALLMAACALPAQPHRAATMRGLQPASARRIAQFGFGREAQFDLCAAAACPAVTRKTATVMPPAGAPTQGPIQPPLARADATPAAIRHATLVVHFAPGSSTLSATARAVLGRALATIRVAGHILIAGRTDNSGRRSANDALALARSRAVLAYMKAKLPPPLPVFTVDARGACCFIAGNDTPDGRRKNRRVELVLRASTQAP